MRHIRPLLRPILNISELFTLYRHRYGYDLPAVQTRMSRDVFKLNINSGNANDCTASRVPRLRASHKTWGETFAKYLRGPDFDFSHDPDGFVFDWGSLREHLNDAPMHRVAKMYQICVDSNRDLEFSDEMRLCQHCEAEVHPPEDTTYSEDADCTFGRCCQDEYIYSDMDEDYIRQDRGQAYYDRNPRRNAPAGYATERALQRSGDYTYSDYFNEWVCEDLYYEYDEPDEEDEEDESSDGLTDYHGSIRNFRARDAKPATLFPPLGVELEVYAEERYDAVEAMRNVASGHRVTIGNLILERDGSLDSDHGFEIVTDPLGRAEWKLASIKILDALEAAGAEDGTEDANHSYGIHVNLARKKCSPLQEARMMMFLCAEENRDFARLISQRDNVYGGNPRLSIGGQRKELQTVSYMGGLRTCGYRGAQNQLPIKKIYGAGKYAPINFKEHVAEFRVFRSTINPVEFMKNVEFVWALYAWTHPMAVTGTSWHYKDFLLWLSASSKSSWERYPNLLTYLHDETRGQDSSVPAPISTYLPREKTTQQSLKLAA